MLDIYFIIGKIDSLIEILKWNLNYKNIITKYTSVGSLYVIYVL